MGAGKSEMVRQFVLLLDSEVKSASPTFALHHRYALENHRIDHWDLYRLVDEDELEASGFWDLLNAGDTMVFVEWAEKIPVEWLPENRMTIKIEFHVQDDFREISVYQAT
jgi:tRNA threonylcarbamoyladenosine biosynthesis protein TsaE